MVRWRPYGFDARVAQNRKDELSQADRDTLSKCKQSQFTGTLVMDAVVAAGVYFGEPWRAWVLRACAT